MKYEERVSELDAQIAAIEAEKKALVAARKAELERIQKEFCPQWEISVHESAHPNDMMHHALGAVRFDFRLSNSDAADAISWRGKRSVLSVKYFFYGGYICQYDGGYCVIRSDNPKSAWACADGGRVRHATQDEWDSFKAGNIPQDWLNDIR